MPLLLPAILVSSPLHAFRADEVGSKAFIDYWKTMGINADKKDLVQFIKNIKLLSVGNDTSDDVIRKLGVTPKNKTKNGSN